MRGKNDELPDSNRRTLLKGLAALTGQGLLPGSMSTSVIQQMTSYAGLNLNPKNIEFLTHDISVALDIIYGNNKGDSCVPTNIMFLLRIPGLQEWLRLYPVAGRYKYDEDENGQPLEGSLEHWNACDELMGNLTYRIERAVTIKNGAVTSDLHRQRLIDLPVSFRHILYDSGMKMFDALQDPHLKYNRDFLASQDGAYILDAGIDIEDIHFLLERDFLYQCGFRANMFPLHPQYARYLDQVETHPLFRYLLWDMADNTELQEALGVPAHKLTGFSEEEIRAFASFSDFHTAMLKRALGGVKLTAQDFLATRHAGLSEFMDFLKPRFQEAEIESKLSKTLELVALPIETDEHEQDASFFADGAVALYAGRVEHWLKPDRKKLEETLSFQFSQAVRLTSWSVVNRDGDVDYTLSVGWNATPEDCARLDRHCARSKRFAAYMTPGSPCR